jgi:uncharacterized protein (DUF1778 family)
MARPADHKTHRFSMRPSEAFVALLAKPGAPAPEIVELMRTPAPW